MCPIPAFEFIFVLLLMLSFSFVFLTFSYIRSCLLCDKHIDILLTNNSSRTDGRRSTDRACVEGRIVLGDNAYFKAMCHYLALHCNILCHTYLCIYNMHTPVNNYTPTGEYKLTHTPIRAYIHPYEHTYAGTSINLRQLCALVLATPIHLPSQTQHIIL